MNIYIVYKTTNLINGRYYIGKHNATDLSTDKYLGSGVVLQQAIVKYGKENFQREVLRTFETEQSAFDYEQQLVTEDVIADPSCYNLKTGGQGGTTPSTELRQHMSEIKQGDKNPMYGKLGNENPNYGKKRPGVGGRNKGTKWSDTERKTHEQLRSAPGYYDYTKDPVRNKKISDAHKGKTGSSLGKKWYNNGVTETYADSCPDGFVIGRKPGRNSNKKGMRWYNNGHHNKQYRDGEVPEGYVHGRISKK